MFEYDGNLKKKRFTYLLQKFQTWSCNPVLMTTTTQGVYELSQLSLLLILGISIFFSHCEVLPKNPISLENEKK